MTNAALLEHPVGIQLASAWFERLPAEWPLKAQVGSVVSEIAGGCEAGLGQ
jgi:hypothetical protein